MDIETRGTPEVQGSTRGRIREAIIRRILKEQIGPGSRLNETSLAKELGVSQTPVREALLQLEGAGVLRSQRGYGFELAALNASQMRDLYSIIAALEGIAVRSSQPLSSSTLSALRVANEQFAQAGSVRELIARDFAWHKILVKSSVNRRALTMVESLKVLAVRHELAYWDKLTAPTLSVAQHETIAVHLEAGEVGAAIDVLQTNWMQGADSCSFAS